HLAQDYLALAQRLLPKVVAVEFEDVEHVVGKRGSSVFERILQALKAGAAVLVENDDLAVEQRAADLQFGELCGDSGKLVGPILAGARIDAAAAAADGGDGAIAIVLDLVQPFIAGRRRVDE